jgi:hypothetical protein
MTKKELAIDIASKEIGYTESPAKSNKTKYGVWYDETNNGKVKANGNQWCAVFVSWVYFMAGIKWPKNLETIRGFIWVPTMTIRARKNGWVTTEPELGDIILFDWTADGGADHVGLFVKWIVKGKTFETIEGNTSPNNQSNGGQVLRRTRKIEMVQHFVKIPI